MKWTGSYYVPAGCLVFVFAPLVIGSCVMLSAAQSQPDVDEDLVTAWRLNYQQAVKDRGEKLLIMQATQAYKDYRAAEEYADKLKATLEATAAKKAPGFTLDLVTGKWSEKK